MGDSDRGRGILTPTDREYLRGEVEYEHKQSKHKRERELRQRIHNAMLDLPLLAEEIEGRDIRKVDCSTVEWRQAHEALQRLAAAAGDPSASVAIEDRDRSGPMLAASHDRVDDLEDDVDELREHVERLLAIVEQLADGEPIPEHTRRGFE